jgi:hypothetical protein
MEGMIPEGMTLFKPGKPTIGEERHRKPSVFWYFLPILDSFKPK